jgi:hypothetical protein
MGRPSITAEALVGIPDNLCFAAFAKSSTLDGALARGCVTYDDSPIAAGILLLLLANQLPTFARGSQVGRDDPWNSERIDRLPPVRSAHVRECGAGRSLLCNLFRQFTADQAALRTSAL